VRHGELNNPKEIVYNRDKVMQSEDIIHLSKTGEKQLMDLAKIIKNQQFRPRLLWTSPETRTVESAEALAQVLKVKLEKKQDLDEIYCPGPYLEKLKMPLWRKTGNPYDQKRWAKYDHEKPANTVKRLTRIFWQIVEKLKAGETGVLVSHGDPIMWLVNYLNYHDILDYPELQKRYYPKKGEAIIFILNLKNKILKHYLLNDF